MILGKLIAPVPVSLHHHVERHNCLTSLLLQLCGPIKHAHGVS